MKYWFFKCWIFAFVFILSLVLNSFHNPLLFPPLTFTNVCDILLTLMSLQRYFYSVGYLSMPQWMKHFSFSVVCHVFIKSDWAVAQCPAKITWLRVSINSHADRTFRLKKLCQICPQLLSSDDDTNTHTHRWCYKLSLSALMSWQVLFLQTATPKRLQLYCTQLQLLHTFFVLFLSLWLSAPRLHLCPVNLPFPVYLSLRAPLSLSVSDPTIRAIYL